MNFKLLFVLAIWSGVAHAAECFENELDPHTDRPYQNQAQWEADIQELWAPNPPIPWIFDLMKGREVAEKESKERVGSDKRRHCYVGCRIANVVNYDVAVYAGYFKEDQDLKDCKRSTRYEPEDLAATILGAEIAREKPGKADKEFCRQRCRKEVR